MKLLEGDGMDCQTSDRLYDYRGSNANVQDCNQGCLDNDNCVGYTISLNNWCFGCEVDPGSTRAGLNYRKVMETCPESN